MYQHVYTFIALNIFYNGIGLIVDYNGFLNLIFLSITTTTTGMFTAGYDTSGLSLVSSMFPFNLWATAF